MLTGMLDGQNSAIATPLFAPAGDGPQRVLSIGGPANRWTPAYLEKAAHELLKVAALLRPALAVA